MTSLLNRRALIAVLVVLVLAAGGLTAWVGTRDEPKVTVPKVLADGRYRVGTAGTDDRQAAVDAAVAALPVALSYDYRSLDESLKKATARMTPGFAETFSKTFDATTREMATDKQAITSALVRGAGVVSLDGNRALCLVYLDQVLLSSKAKKADDPLKVSQNRVHVELRKIDGKWRVSDIEPF